MSLETGKEQGNKFERTISSIDLGTYSLVITHRMKGGYTVLPVKSSRADYLHSKTKDLPPSATSYLSGFDPDLLNLAEVGILPVKMSWHQGRGVLEEPQMIIKTKDAFTFANEEVILSDVEIADMFTKTAKSGFKAASIISINTVDGDILGIATKRNNPNILLFAPSIDGSNMTSKEGLNNFLSDLINNMSTKITPFTGEVLSALSEANQSGYFELPYDSNTSNGKLQNNILLQLFTIRTLFIAREAESSGLGKNDPKIIEQFPYLKNYGQAQKKGLFGSIVSSATAQKTLKLTPSIYNELVEDASKGIILKNPHDKTPRPSKIRPLETRLAQTANIAVMSKEEIAKSKQAAQELEQSQKQKQELIKPINSCAQLLDALRSQFSSSEKIRPITDQDLQITSSILKQAGLELGKITATARRNRPPQTPTAISLDVSDTIKSFGIKGAKLMDFMSPTHADYQVTIENSVNKWISESKYLDQQIRSKKELRKAETLHKSDNLKPLAENLKAALNLKDVRVIPLDVDLVQVTFLVLVAKISYTLKQSGEQLLNRGQAIEVANWAHYSKSIIDKLNSIFEIIK